MPNWFSKMLLKSHLLAVTLTLCTSIWPSDTWAQFPSGPGGPEFGRGDFKEAVAIWQQLAEQGDAKAQETLGWAYEDGRALPRDYAKAAAWYLKAATQDRTFAQSKLGDFYYSGRGVHQDFQVARSWFLRAAQAGDIWALRSLAMMATHGHGEPISQVEAYKWYDLATRCNAEDSALLEQKRERDIFGLSMTAMDVEEAKRLAQAWERANWPAQWPQDRR